MVTEAFYNLLSLPLFSSFSALSCGGFAERESPSLSLYNCPARPQTVLEMKLACREMTESTNTLQKHQLSQPVSPAAPVTEHHFSVSRVCLCLSAAVICHQHLL